MIDTAASLWIVGGSKRSSILIIRMHGDQWRCGIKKENVNLWPGSGRLVDKTKSGMRHTACAECVISIKLRNYHCHWVWTADPVATLLRLVALEGNQSIPYITTGVAWSFPSLKPESFWSVRWLVCPGCLQRCGDGGKKQNAPRQSHQSLSLRKPHSLLTLQFLHLQPVSRRRTIIRLSACFHHRMHQPLKFGCTRKSIVKSGWSWAMERHLGRCTENSMARVRMSQQFGHTTWTNPATCRPSPSSFWVLKRIFSPTPSERSSI